MSRQRITTDLYKVLNVPRGATSAEIKVAYRKLALALHPDRHDGCQIKTKQFKEASNAYNILTSNNLRREYDLSSGVAPTGWHNKNRRRAPPSDYRKVYTPHAPKNGKWHDAQRHYDMHYGDGQYREAVKQAFNRAQVSGEFDYRSPLGKGFSFEKIEDRKARYGKNSYYKNPYSKEEQGPPIQQYNYEEAYTSKDMATAKTVVKRRENIVQKLHERRQERRGKESVESSPMHPGQQKIYERFNQQSDEACTIM